MFTKLAPFASSSDLFVLGRGENEKEPSKVEAPPKNEHDGSQSHAFKQHKNPCSLFEGTHISIVLTFGIDLGSGLSRSVSPSDLPFPFNPPNLSWPFILPFFK